MCAIEDFVFNCRTTVETQYTTIPELTCFDFAERQGRTPSPPCPLTPSGLRKPRLQLASLARTS